MIGRCAESRCSQLVEQRRDKRVSFATPVSTSRPPFIRHLQPASSPVHPESLFLILSSQTYETGLLFNQSYAFSSARSSFRISSTSIPKGHSTGVPSRGPANENAALKEKGPRMRSRMLSDSNPISKIIKSTSRPLLLDLTDPAIDKWYPENLIMIV